MYATMAARLSVIKALPDDPHLALKYLERKRREEFAAHHTPLPPKEPQIDLGAEALARLEKYMQPPVASEVAAR